MRIWYRKPGKPTNVPAGLRHLQGNEWITTEHRAGHEAIGADPASWSMDPVPAAVEAPAESPEKTGKGHVAAPLTRQQAAAHGQAAARKAKQDHQDEDEGED